MTYEEFVSPDFREKYRALISFRYDWKLAGISREEARANGLGRKFVFWTTTAYAMAVIEFLLVRIEGKTLDKALDEYVEKHFSSLYIEYYDYLPLMFKDEAIKQMKEIIPVSG